uniref:Uncharacterized protein n=1 Tax=Triticum urartu TaxID=4572 RepID=A0A8R7P918_TRIUA
MRGKELARQCNEINAGFFYSNTEQGEKMVSSERLKLMNLF